MPRLLIILLALCAATFAGPAAARTTTAEKLARVHTIGVISTVGQRFTMQLVGLTVFGNKGGQLRVEDWRVDEHIEERVATTLGDRLAFKLVAFDPAAFTAPRRPQLFTSFSPGKAVRALPDQGVEVYIVLAAETRQDARFGTRQYFDGLGLFRYANPFEEGPKDVLHANYAIWVVEAKTGKVLTYNPALIPSVRFGHEPPAKALEVDLWADKPESMPADRKAELRNLAEALIDQSLDATLTEMHLTEPPGLE
jgi:hypothetical protein